MSNTGVIAFLFVLLILSSSGFLLTVEALDSEGGVLFAVDSAEVAVGEVFGAVLRAEAAGANVSELLERLDVAVEYLAMARVSLRREDPNGAFGNVSLCLETLEGVVSDARILRDRTVRESHEQSLIAMSGSAVGVVAVACGSLLGWNWFKKRYYDRAMGMKPEVVDGES